MKCDCNHVFQGRDDDDPEDADMASDDMLAFLIECPACDGDGWYTDAEGEYVTCEECDGEGWV